MAKRLFLHTGTPKTGTTSIQRLLWANKAALEEQGVLLPLDSVRDHFFLSNLGRDSDEDVANMPPRALGAWDQMMEQVAAWPRDVLISHELFAMTYPERAPWIIEQLGSVSEELHPIITARDLARQVPAEWQQTIKHGRTHTLRQYYDMVREHDDTILFWQAQDLPAQVRMWSEGLPAGRVHLITVPPRGGSPTALWERFASVVGIDLARVTAPADVHNVSLGVVEAELLRRVNVHAPMGATKPLQQLMVREVLGDGILAQRQDTQRFAPPADVHPWVVECGTAMVDDLRELTCDVVGDLDELLPGAEPVAGPVPDDVPDRDIAAVAVETISAVLYRSHDRELAGANREIARLKQASQDKAAELREARAQLRQARAELREARTRAANAQQALEHERGVPVWRHAARRAKAAGRRALGRSPR